MKHAIFSVVIGIVCAQLAMGPAMADSNYSAGPAELDGETYKLFCGQAPAAHQMVTPNATKTLASCETSTLTETDIGTTTPGAGKIPIAGTDSKISVDWMPPTVATGSGTATYLPKFGGTPPALVDSLWSDNGTRLRFYGPLGYGVDSPSAPIEIGGSGATNATMPGFVISRTDSLSKFHLQHYYAGITYFTQNLYRDASGTSWYLDHSAYYGVGTYMNSNASISPNGVGTVVCSPGFSGDPLASAYCSSFFIGRDNVTSNIPIVAPNIRRNLAAAKTYTFSPSPHASYPDGGGQLANGLVRETQYAGSATDIGWNNQDVTTTVDLGANYYPQYARIFYGHDGTGDINVPSAIVLSTSTDDVTYTTRATKQAITCTTDCWVDIWWKPAQARYIKTVSTEAGNWTMMAEFQVYEDIGSPETRLSSAGGLVLVQQTGTGTNTGTATTTSVDLKHGPATVSNTNTATHTHPSTLVCAGGLACQTGTVTETSVALTNSGTVTLVVDQTEFYGADGVNFQKTATKTDTVAAASTVTGSGTGTNTGTGTGTRSTFSAGFATAIRTYSTTATSTATATLTGLTGTATSSASTTESSTGTATFTASGTATNTIYGGSETASGTGTGTWSATKTNTGEGTGTFTATGTHQKTFTGSGTFTVTLTVSGYPTITGISTSTNTGTANGTAVATATWTDTITTTDTSSSTSGGYDIVGHGIGNRSVYATENQTITGYYDLTEDVTTGSSATESASASASSSGWSSFFASFSTLHGAVPTQIPAGTWRFIGSWSSKDSDPYGESARARWAVYRRRAGSDTLLFYVDGEWFSGGPSGENPGYIINVVETTADEVQLSAGDTIVVKVATTSSSASPVDVILVWGGGMTYTGNDAWGYLTAVEMPVPIKITQTGWLDRVRGRLLRADGQWIDP